MNKISSLLTETSMLEFTNGEQVKGANEVSEIILHCCREYNSAYNYTKKKQFVTEVLSGLVIVGVGLGINYIVKHIKKSKKIEIKEEA